MYPNSSKLPLPRFSRRCCPQKAPKRTKPPPPYSTGMHDVCTLAPSFLCSTDGCFKPSFQCKKHSLLPCDSLHRPIRSQPTLGNLQQPNRTHKVRRMPTIYRRLGLFIPPNLRSELANTWDVTSNHFTIKLADRPQTSDRTVQSHHHLSWTKGPRESKKRKKIKLTT